MTSRAYPAALERPVRITIPAEHVPVLRLDLLNRLAIEADGVEMAEQLERRGYGYGHDGIIEALQEMQRLVGLLEDLGLDRPSWDPGEDVPPDQAVTGTADADMLSRDYTEQLHELDAYLCESTVDGSAGRIWTSNSSCARRCALAQIPPVAVAA